MSLATSFVFHQHLNMDNPQLVMLRTPLEAQNQLLIFNSPIEFSDQQLIVYQYPGMVAGDSGFCVVYKRDHYIINNPPNYQSPTKRSFLNECIRQLYIMNGLAHKLHWETNAARKHQRTIWQQVDTCLQPEKISIQRASLRNVKRQLFREARGQRKQKPPVRGKLWGTQVFYFKPVRNKLTRRNVPRDCLRGVRRMVLHQMLRDALRRQMTHTPTVSQSVINAAQGIFNMNPNVMNEICNYHNNTARHHPAVESRLSAGEASSRYNEACQLTQRAKRLEAMFIHEQVRRAVQNHQYILEESVRSVFYAKQLFRLIEDHEEFVYTDNQIMERTSKV